MQIPWMEEPKLWTVWTTFGGDLTYVLDKISIPHQHFLVSTTCHVGSIDTILEWALSSCKANYNHLHSLYSPDLILKGINRNRCLVNPPWNKQVWLCSWHKIMNWLHEEVRNLKFTSLRTSEQMFSGCGGGPHPQLSRSRVCGGAHFWQVCRNPGRM